MSFEPVFVKVNFSFLLLTVIIKPVNSALYKCKVFSFVHYTISIPKYLFQRRHENNTIFPPPLSNILSSLGTKSPPLSLTVKLNRSRIPSFQPETSSIWNFKHISISSSIKSSFSITLFNVILLNRQRQYISF